MKRRLKEIALERKIFAAAPVIAGCALIVPRGYLESHKHDALDRVEIICFHCQQAVEKLLKGLLIYFGEEIIKTHDLTLLVSRLQNFVDLSDDEKKICAKLSLYAVETRYPHELEIQEQHVKAAVEDTKIIFNRLKNFMAENTEEVKP